MKMIILFFLSLFSTIGAAEDLVLKSVVADCAGSESCPQREARFLNLSGEYRSLLHLKSTLKVLASDGGYETFSYKLVEENGVNNLYVKFTLKPVVLEVNVGFTDKNLEIDPSQLISVREGEFFEQQKIDDSISHLQKRLENLGFPENSHQLEVLDRDGQKVINVVITLGKPTIFKTIRTNSNSKFVKEHLRKKFLTLYNKPFDQNKFKILLDDAQKELFSYGYYLMNLDFKPVVKGYRVTLSINVTNDTLFAFDFKNIKREREDIIHTLVIDLFHKYKRLLPEGTIRQAIKDHYKKLALLNVEVKITPSKFNNKFGEEIHLYRIELIENVKTRITSVAFTGSLYFHANKIKRMFQKEAFELASINYYDEDFLNYFADFLKSKYIKNGFVQVRIKGPLTSFDEGRNKAKVEYNISEGQRAMVRSIEFTGLPEGFTDKILAMIENKEDQAFNPIALSEDLKVVTNALQESGYYFAEVTNANEDSLVRYSKSGSDVYIQFNIVAGPEVKLNRVIFMGNNKTRKKALLRKITLKEGEFITPSKTKEIESNLSATGLFNTVSVQPLRHTSHNASTDLIIKLTEREFGLLELAPGYRTDLGLKLSGTVSYLNIGGMNRSLILKGQVNQRLNYQTFDARRRKEHKALLEYNASINYAQENVFESEMDYGSGLSLLRKRFFAFDADILRWNHTLTKYISRTLSTSLRYQYETITQFDATQARDNGQFKIGAFTPGVSWDLRNSRVLPVKGAMFNLSTEFANPYFLSQDNPDLTINYYKLISRNRFYIPFKNGTVALSMVGGVQENLARERLEDSEGNSIIDDGVKKTKGYIPNIKVFRLSGMDIIRGFTDEEANVVKGNKDISKIRVQERAYVTNFKLEPRYFINDKFMTGVFYDAGRVFVDRINIGDLRDSVGVTFKILTPVGTLDFDYGIKLLRKKDVNGRLEDPGRFHVSIGFF